MDQLEKLRKTCYLLEKDIQDTLCEIIELKIAHEALIEELMKARQQLYKEIEKRENINLKKLNRNQRNSI